MNATIDERRRRLLLGALALPFANAALALPSAPARPQWMVSGFYYGRGERLDNRLRWVDVASGEQHELALDFRPHGMTFHPRNEQRLVVFARRPGTHMLELDLQAGRIMRSVGSPSGRHYYGHGVFSADGRWLYTTENHVASGEGLICVRDGVSLQPVDTLHSHGIGPHDIRLLSDGRTLVVANGGIRTDPTQPRRKLNIPDMDPSLVYLDRESGQLLEQHRLDDHQLSIRHLAVTPSDQVVAIQQYEGRRPDAHALVMFHRLGEKPRVPRPDPRTLKRMTGYTASAAADDRSCTALVSSPRGNLLTLWDTADNRLLASFDLFKPYGVALSPDGRRYAVSTAGAGLHMLDIETRELREVRADARGSWDNHMLWRT